MQNVNRNFIYEDSKLTQPFGNNICLWMQWKKKKKKNQRWQLKHLCFKTKVMKQEEKEGKKKMCIKKTWTRIINYEFLF